VCMVKDILRIVFSHKTRHIDGRGGGFLVHLAIGLLECRFAASVFMVYMLIKLRNV
jgi:hypothetical protein